MSHASNALTRYREEPESSKGSSAAPRGPLGGGGFRIGRIAGIDLRVDWSLSIIFALILFDLGASVLPSWHPEWSVELRWAVALAAAVLFFVSVLAHELSHALVAKAKGLPVPRITLFLFGGVAEMEREPDSPGSEALITIVGPLTSLAIGVGSLLIVGAIVEPGQMAAIERSPTEVSDWLSTLGPVPTLLMWLGPVNIALALFNMVPGFPLDGGRLLRALLWWGTKDLNKATRWAAYSGRTFGWALMIIGLLNAFRGDFGDGLWLVLIGWFLSNAAQMSLQQHMLTQALSGVPVGRVMRTRFERVDPETTVDELADRVLHTDSDQRAFPVEREGLLLGLVCLQDVRKVPRDEWPRRRVSEIMTPVEKLTMLRADVPAQRAAEQLAKNEVDNIPVVADSAAQAPVLLGMVRRADILRWVYLSNQPA